MACGGTQKKEDGPVGRPPSADDLRPFDTKDADRRHDQKGPDEETEEETDEKEEGDDGSAKRQDPWTAKARAESQAKIGEDLRFPGEERLVGLVQLSRGGQNAEAYFSPAGDRLSFQSTRGDIGCDRIFTMKLDGTDLQRVSNGMGVTTCAHYLPDNKHVVFASTHLEHRSCPPKPSPREFGGYVWPVYPEYEIFIANPDGGELQQLTNVKGYDAEATVSPAGDRIVFTSARDGDLDIYSMKIDGSDVKRLTNKPGYDGGAFYSWDGKKIVYRAHHPVGPKAQGEFKSLLERGVVKPTQMELWVMDADGKNQKRLTSFGAASFAPFFHPDNKRIAFVSNFHDPARRNFEIYVINIDGTNLERITYNPTFDGFPMFDKTGTKLVFASNRANTTPHETNIFLAEWRTDAKK